MEVGDGWRESSYSRLPFCSNRVSNQEPLNKESSTAEYCPYYTSHPLHCLKPTTGRTFAVMSHATQVTRSTVLNKPTTGRTFAVMSHATQVTRSTVLNKPTTGITLAVMSHARPTG